MSEVDLGSGPFRFGVYEVHPRTGELLKQGRQIKLRGRPFDILVLLLERRGDVITREELRQRLWTADTFVDFDHGLNAAVNRLREALGDSAENPRFIETLPKRGYRFLAPITVAASEAIVPAVMAAEPAQAALAPPTLPTTRSFAISRPSRVVLLLAGAAFLFAVVMGTLYLRVAPTAGSRPSKMTLAVLPFQNLSTDRDQEFLSDGFTEEMIAEIGKLDPDHLGVIARTTTMLYKNARKSVGQIRQELGVDYVLEGSIRRADNRVRITAQLVQTTDMTHLWAESYDRDVSDVLEIQSEVAMKIARSLTLALNRLTTDKHSGSTSFPAYELCLRGRAFREQATEEGARKAIEYYQRAIALDPNYAPAHAGLADAFWLLGAPGWEVDRPAVLLDRAKASAERALAIDPQSAEAHAVMAMLRLAYQWDRTGSEREIQEAIRLNPSYAQAHQYYSTTLTTLERFDDAIGEAHKAMNLDPLSPPAATTLGIRFLYARRYSEAAAQFAKTIEANPEFGVAHWGLGQCYRQRGDVKLESEELQRAVELSGNSAYMRAHLAFGLAAAGDRGRAMAIQRELEAEGRERYASPYHQALIAAGLGDRAGVIQWLQRAFVDRSGWMVFLQVEPEFDNVRQMPEFQQLIARVKPIT
jgi:TolB-like protein/DNA-binding winged helix-turn-helix (wHTH) protein/Tfp pilus assembly protein PilF